MKIPLGVSLAGHLTHTTCAFGPCKNGPRSAEKKTRFEATRGASFKKSLKSATSHHACSADLRNGREVLDRRKNHLFVGFEADDDGIEGSVTGSSGSKLSYPAATASKSCACACAYVQC